MNGFEPVPLKEAGLFGRLLKRKLSANAYAEIQNLLAGTPIREVPDDVVDRILFEYELTLVDARPQLREMYTTALRYFVHDLELADAEIEDLKRLKHLFNLTDDDIRAIEAAGLGATYRNVLADDRITLEEQAQLTLLIQRLRLPDPVANEARAQEGKAALQSLLNRSIEDRRLSSDEEAQLAALAKALGTEVTLGPVTLETLEQLPSALADRPR